MFFGIKENSKVLRQKTNIYIVVVFYKIKMEGLIKNSDFLSPDVSIEHIPELIYERKEVPEIKKLIKNSFNQRYPKHFTLLSGASGSGKTVLIKYSLYQFINEHPEYGKDFIYVDGHQTKTSNSAIKFISNHLGGGPNGRDESSFFENIKKHINNQKKRKLIIFDEIDKIMANVKSKEKHHFLLSLWRLPLDYPISILAITNKFNLQDSIPSELSASINENTLSSYQIIDFIEILKKRAGYCLDASSYTIEDLAKIAKATFMNPIGADLANARFALNILMRAACIAQDKNKKIGDVLDRAIEQVKKDNFVGLLQKYNQRQLLLIETLAKEKEKVAKGIYLYSNPPLQYQQIITAYNQLSDLECYDKTPERTIQRYLYQFIDEGFLRRINKNTYIFLENHKDILLALNKIKQKNNISLTV